ncbi:Copper chaperone CopZ [Flavobacteriaceae bacterium MAR_2010_188]|nr:Copper chaperone CopZ [Flavobacteriaceae bacterium MAR_2010_188]
MKSKNSSYSGIALLTAVSASICCIAPILGLVAGAGSVASSFSWLEPYRPYIIGMTIVILMFAWYQQLKPKQEMDCECEDDEEKKSFLKSKTFLTIVTIFAGLMLAFPSYSNIFYDGSKTENIAINPENLKTLEVKISGMTCSSCEVHIYHAIQELPGIKSVNASYEKGNAVVKFDNSKTDEKMIAETINSTGYKVID